jgi:hypothetical protein
MAGGGGGKPFPERNNSDGKGAPELTCPTHKNSRRYLRGLAASITTAIIRHSGVQVSHGILLEARSQHEYYRAAHRRWAGRGQRPRCISFLTLRFDSETTKHQRNVKSRDPNHNLIVKQAAAVIVMLRFLLTKPIPCRR